MDGLIAANPLAKRREVSEGAKRDKKITKRWGSLREGEASREVRLEEKKKMQEGEACGPHNRMPQLVWLLEHEGRGREMRPGYCAGLSMSAGSGLFSGVPRPVAHAG